MDYRFPTITCLDDVLPAIEGASEFTVTRKDGYTVVNYFMTNPHETFPEVVYGEADGCFPAMRRECRGLIFDEDGKLISRPYHKFFNLNERAETQDIDLTKPHVILEKLDGSMIRPLFLKGVRRPRWATKAGITEVSMQVETWLAEDAERSGEYEHFAGWCEENNITPIFEWCSRSQRIVLDYEYDELVLTALRNKTTGQYYSYISMASYAKQWNLAYVQIRSMPELDEKDSEGVVIRFDDGHMVKVKTDWYALRHKALDGLRSEKNVLKLILDNGIDDVLPLLDDTTKKRLEDYTSAIIVSVGKFSDKLYHDFYLHNSKERKDFAMWAKTQSIPSVCFKMYDGVEIEKAIQEYIGKNLQSQMTVDKIRPLLGATW